jgi:polar amino acid transport system substrate-binding protein
MKNVIFIIIPIIFLSVIIGGCDSCNRSTSVSSLEKIKTGKKIKVGYISYFEITDRDGNTGETKGFLVDVLVEALKNLNIPKENIEFVETDWANFGLGLQSGKYDLSIAGTFNTEVRAKVVNFSRPILYLGNGAVVKQNDDRFHSIGDFNKEGITIAVVQGEQGYEYAKKNLTKAQITALSGSDLSLAPLEVKLGKADAALSDQYILRRYCDKNPEVRDALKENPYDVLPICWSVSKEPKDSSLLNYINVQLIKMENSGKMQELITKYPMIPFAKAPVK